MKIFNPVVRGLSVGPAQTNFPILIYKVPGNVAVPNGTWGNVFAFNASLYTQFKATPFGTYMLWVNLVFAGGATGGSITARVNLNGSGTDNVIWSETVAVPAASNATFNQQFLVPLFGTIQPDITVQMEGNAAGMSLVGNGTPTYNNSYLELMELGTNQS